MATRRDPCIPLLVWFVRICSMALYKGVVPGEPTQRVANFSPALRHP